MAASLWWDDGTSSSSRSNQDNKKQQEDLSVFGYACKLFRDDERARDIDQGKLLIPWMGDESLMIDRYDGRGHLYDLATHDAANVVDKNPELSEEEKAVDKACDEERYLELYKDVQEEAMYEEEEWKRYYLALQEGYQAVGFSYDQQHNSEAETIEALENKKQVEEEKELPFVVPEALNVPSDMTVPTCIKQHARIEKTATFIAQHGVQMEIMLKTRQAGNDQFNFLYFEDVLNPFYKHVVSMIKSRRYKPLAVEEKENDEENYLHPSLSSAPQVPLPPLPPPPKPMELPKVAIHDTPYGALINSIKKYSAAAASSSPISGSPIQDQEQETVLPANQQHDSAPYEEKPIELYATAAHTLYGPALEERLCGRGPSDSPSNDHYKRRRRRRRARTSSSDSSSSSSSSSSGSSSSRKKRKKSKSPSPKPRPRAEGPATILQPPSDIQPIIDRMALYVAKNGIEFEVMVMGRNDPRFQFLNEYHAYFPYYRLKREVFLTELGRDLESEDKKDDAKEGGLVSVSFSIKAKAKESEPVTASKSKLFDYDSSEGDEEQRQRSISEAPSRTATKPVDGDDSVHAEEKVKDKLASAVKGRISQSSKEKNLQAERKKKAAMFLTMIKANRTESPPPSASIIEDSSTLYVGEPASSSAVVYEYDNQPTPHRVEKNRSPRDRHRRRKSPTPPSAYNLERRSTAQLSPHRRQARGGGQWSFGWDRDRDRDHSSSWSRRYTDYGKSPPRKLEKKKKHKRSKSRSPSKKEKSNDRSRHPKEKSKHKSKDKDRDRGREKKKKSRHSRSREKEITKQTSSRPSRDSSTSDVEVMEELTELSAKPSHDSRVKVSNGDSSKDKKDAQDFVQSDGHDINIPLPGSTSSTLSGVHQRLSSDPSNTMTSKVDADDSKDPSHTTDCIDNEESVQSQKTDLSPSTMPLSSSSDLRNKVRAMLKRSREMILKEESFLFEDT